MAKKLQIFGSFTADPNLGTDNAGQLVYIADDGSLTPLGIGSNLTIDNGVLHAAISGGDSSGGTETTNHGIVWDLVNVISSNPIASVSAGASLVAVLTPADGYDLGDVTVTMGGEVVTDCWNADTATVTIANVTGDVVISCAGVAQSTGDVVDTSPVIEASGYGLGTSETPGAKTGLCYTQAYPLVGDGVNDVLVKYLFPNYDSISMGQYNKNHCFMDGEFVSYWTQYYKTDPADETESSCNIGASYGSFNTIKFTLVETYAEDSYAYNATTGDIIFAGRNTKYYGMTNIDGSSGGTEAGTSVASTVDNTVMMLAMSSGETAVASDYPNLSAEYVTMVQANYDAMMAECLGDYTKIPLIVHTDQHGDLSNGKGGNVLKLIGTITNWYEIGKCINLGDTCGNTFAASTLQSYLDNAADYIPLSKRVEVYGNHDIWDDDETQKYTVSQKRLSPYFKNIFARRHGNNGYFTVIDDYYNVKYLAINNMEYPDTNYSTQRITTTQAEYIVSELSKDDGYDIIILSHIPIDSENVTLRDGSAGGYATPFLTDATANASFQTMLAARKNKTTGTFTDSEGAEHSYDFSGVTGDILISLHGHDHHEAYKTTASGVTEFLFDCMKEYDTLFYFAYIDRASKKFKYWRNEVGADAMEITIA